MTKQPHRAQRSSRWFAAPMLANLAVGVALVVYGWALFAPPPGPWQHLLHDDGAMFVYLAVALRLLVAARSGSALREAWSWLATAMVVLAAAMFGYYSQSQAVIAGHKVGMGDLVWLLAYTPAVIGVAGIARVWAPGPERTAILDASLTTVGSFGLTIALISQFLHSAAGQQDALALAVSVSTVYFDIMLVAIVLAMVQRLRWRPPRAVWALLFVTMLFAIGDIVYAVLVGTGTYVSGGIVDLTWPLSAAGFAFAAGSMSENPPSVEAPLRDPVVMLPPVVFSVLAVLLIVAPISGPLALLARLAAVVTVLLSVLRLRAAVTTAVAMAEELRVSTVDALTGLLNRRGLLGLVEAEVLGATLVTIDIDGLGEINRTYGMGVGDQLILTACDRVRSEVRADDVVARTGDDEFSVLLRGTDGDAALRVARALVSALEREVTIQNNTLHLSACAGVSSRARFGVGAHALVSEAEIALQDAQRLGSGIVRSFVADTGERSQEQIRMRTRIKDLLRSGSDEFVPYFQPILTVDGTEVYAVESLVRWHRDGQVLTPAAFLGEVERSGSMPALTEHMLVSGLRQLRAHGLPFPMTLNVSPDLVDVALIDMVLDALRETNSRPEQMIVEITEHAIVRDGAMAAQVLNALRHEGVRVLLDDFGTGWSGLSSLRDLAVDGIKLDGSFIAAMWTDRVSGAIVRGVTQVAEDLGIDVIYEGVEDPALLTDFASLGRGAVQGYAIAHPMSIAGLVDWAAAHSRATATR